MLPRIRLDSKTATTLTSRSRRFLPVWSSSWLTRLSSKLEAQISSGSLSLFDEKKVVSEISNLRKAKKSLESLSSEQTSIETDRARMDEYKTELDALEPKRKEIKEQIDAVKAELDAVKAELNKSMDSINQFYSSRNEIREKINEAYTEMKAFKALHKKTMDEHYAAKKEEYERKKVLFQEQKEKEKAERIARQAQVELELAEIPAYTEEINLCNNLLKFLAQQYNVVVEEEESKSEEAKPAFEGRQVDTEFKGAVLLTKKDDDDYMVLGKGKKEKKKSGSAKPKAIRFDLDMMDQLNKLKVDVPLSADQLQETADKIVEKKKSFLKNQAEKTAENKRKAEEKVKALAAAEENQE